jgi:hypothetical protein
MALGSTGTAGWCVAVSRGMGSGLVEARTGGAARRDCPGPAVADAETARNLAASRSTVPYLRVLNTPRTPNPAFRDWGRSARLGPSRRRRGSRRYGTPPAAAHRRCNPAHRDERRLRPSAAGAPARHQGSAPSAGWAKCFLSRFSSHHDAGVVAAGGACAAANRPRISAPPGREEGSRSAVH